MKKGNLKQHIEIGNRIKDVEAAIMELDALSSNVMPKKIRKYLRASIDKIGIFKSLAEYEMRKKIGDDSLCVAKIFYVSDRRVDPEGQDYKIWK